MYQFGGVPYQSKLKYHDPNIDNEAWDFGLIRDEDKTREQLDDEELIRKSLMDFKIQGRTEYTSELYGNEKKVCLFDLWKHPLVVQANGFEFTGTHQITGSCVGAGGCNATFSTIAADAIIRKDPELALVPFWLLPYGRSRYYLGMRSRGSGSSGTTFAKAMRDDGAMPAKSEGLPSFTTTDGLTWGSAVELQWSNGVFDSKYAELARKNLIKTTSLLKNADDVREAICNYYGVSIASNWGGVMKPPVTDGVLLSRRATTWNHQMSVQAWWEHPKLGELYWIHNQWGLNAHGRCPSGAPPGGFWVKKAEIDWICRQNEAYAFSGWDGYPARKIEGWYI